MNPKNFGCRTEAETGDIWLTEEKYRTKPRYLKNITGPVLLALTSDLHIGGEATQATRFVKFSDRCVRITIEHISEEEYDREQCRENDAYLTPGEAGLPDLPVGGHSS